MKKLTTLLILLLLIGCSDDATDTVEPQRELFIKEVLKDGMVQYRYTYQNGLISTMEYFDNEELTFEYFYSYNRDTIFIDNHYLPNDEVTKSKYYQISENEVRRDLFDTNDQLESYRIYKFSDEDCGYVDLDIYDSDDSLLNSFFTELLDANCSVEVTVVSSNTESVYRHLYQRDGKNKYNKNAILHLLRADNIGNTIQYNYWGSDGELNHNISYESTFEYNEKDYPVSEQRNYLNGESIEFNYVYYE